MNDQRDDGINRLTVYTTNNGVSKAVSVAELLNALFPGNETGHHVFYEVTRDNDGLYKYHSVDYRPGPPTLESWSKHLLGTTGIGRAPILLDGTVRFACIDVDTHGEHAYEFVPGDVVRKIKSKKLPLIVVVSKNGGLHLFAFFREPVPAIMVRRIMSTWAKFLGFPDAEIFPAQDAVSKDGKGSNLWMPYFGAFSDKQLPVEAAINETGGHWLVENFVYDAQQKAISLDELATFELRGPGRPRKEAAEPKERGPRYGTPAWAKQKLDEACATLRGCKDRYRDGPALACFFPGRMVGGGLLDDEETWAALCEAMEQGDPDDEMRSKAERHYSDGKNQPLDYKAKRDAPTIRIEPNQVADNVDQMEYAIIQSNRGLYQRSGKIVYPCPIKGMSHDGEETLTPGVEEVSLNRLYELADKVAVYEKFTNKHWSVCNAPRDLVSVLRERGGDLRFPVLRATINTPVVFPNGRILDQPGYDADSGLLYDPQGVEFPAIQPDPIRDDAIAALRVINEPFEHYRFKDNRDDSVPREQHGSVSRSVAISLAVTACVRPTLDLAPGYAISASDKGSGKGKMVGAVSILAVGDKPRTITQGKDEEEFEKRLVSELRENTGMISISNCTHPIQGEFVEEFLTNKRVNPRILGLSENITVDNTNLLVWNGNNLEVIGDTVRRFVRLYISPGVEFAYKQQFPFDPIDYTRTHRVRIVTAINTLLRGYCLAADKPKMEPLHNYDLWSYFVRGAIVWAGGADPVLSQDDVVLEDESRLELARVMIGWEDAMGTWDFYNLSQIVDRASAWDEHANNGRGGHLYPDFFDALEDSGLFDRNGKISSKKLGRWLRPHENTIVDGMQFVKQFNQHRKSYDWMLRKV